MLGVVSYLVLACDYDGTLATDGMVDEPTIRALERWRGAGRRLVLVTGRQLADLKTIFPAAWTLFEWIVAENGPVVFQPASGDKRLLASSPPTAFIQDLRRRQVVPLSVGDVVVATTRENAAEVLAAIQDLGLELAVIFNKASLMVLPTGISKATGLTAVLRAMSIAPAEVAGIGDAENDEALIGLCGLGVAVANAVPELRAQADRVMQGGAGFGVAELVDDLLGNDQLSERAT